MRQPNRRRHNRKQDGSDQRDRWMITYADLITLLLIFFVVMYAMSRLDTEKYKLVTQSLQATFQSGDSILEMGSGITGTADTENHKNPPPQTAVTEDKEEDNGEAPLTERELAFRAQEEELANFMGLIQQYVKDNQLEEDIFISDEPQGIAITLSDRFLFDVGKAELKSGAAPVLGKLASLFGDLNTTVSIEGHTDNVPIGRHSSYKDNWELSGARAMSVLRFFLEDSKLDPAGFQYAGYADTRPAADNATPEGKQKNRRVEITVLRQLKQ
ncbi:OmpA/MotB family protein [Paenibacillus glucanolyticus]|uniref:OmpA/MotB family protein n=1 Tax=Paenibacillus glucanolyticus TaxID=59843 RepID=UPI00096E19E4|nr:flagellar motor protein MotB [Paenibacillus glucanolyticus]OMF81821.1 flagellar motor protein [Paenibacillus glucanolyticus]